MADDIQIFVKVVGQKDIVSTTDSLNKMESGVKRLSKDLSKGRVSGDQYTTGLKELRRGVDSLFPSWQKAKTAVDQYSKGLIKATADQAKSKAAIEADKQATKAYTQARREATQEDQRRNSILKANRDALNAQRVAVEANTAQVHKYRMASDAVYAAEQKLLQLKKTLRTEIANGNMTMREAAAVQMQYKQSLNQVSAGLQQTRSRQSQLGVLFQQTGYQVGDFAVQVQSGQNAMVAFGQQATQLVGTFGMLSKSTKMIGLFAGLGIAIPVITAIGAALMRARNESKSFESSTFDINEAAKNATKELKDYREELALLTSEYKTLGEVGLDKQISNAQKELNNLLLSRQKILDSAKTSFGAEGATSGVEEMVKTALSERTMEMNAQIFAKKEQLRLLVQERESLERVKEVTGEINSLVEDGRVANLERNRSSRQAVIDMQSELNLQQQIAKYGAESLEVARYRAEQEAIVKNLTAESAKKYVELAIESYKVQMQIDSSADSAKSLSGFFDRASMSVDVMNARLTTTLGKIGGILSAIGSIGFETVAIQAETAALKAGKSQVQATVEGQLAQDRSEMMQSGPLSPMQEALLVTKRSALEERVKAAAARQAELDKLKPSGGGSSGGGGVAPKDEVAEAIKKLQEQLTLQEALVGKTEAQRQVVQALGVDYEKIYGSGATDAIIARIEALKAEEEQIANIQSVSNTMKSSMSDAFMSMVEGTKSFKDSMKDMARAVIKQLFDILVVQRIVGSFNAATGVGSGIVGSIMGAFQADGGAWQGGSQIKAYANGGVVGGPTYFPMSGGKTGLMGEAGPEAIMPLKRGANGKLGVQMEGNSSGDVNIVQNFSFQANGDESVKRIIASEAPKIASMTQRQIMDQRRRGGAMKSAFG